MEEITKENAINILEDIEKILYEQEYNKEKALREIDDCIKSVKLTTDVKINTLINKHQEYIKSYGKNDIRTLSISRRIDKEIRKIYSS